MFLSNSQFENLPFFRYFPPFQPKDASVWLQTLEKEFEKANIITQAERYWCLNALLTRDSSDLANIQIKSTQFPFDDAKAVILRRCQLAVDESINKELSEYLRGNEKPSEILNRMYSSEQYGYLQDAFPTELFIQRLSLHFQYLLKDKLSHYNIDQLAQMEDFIFEAILGRSNHAFHIIDQNSGVKFAIDSGSEHSFILPSSYERNTVIPISWIKAPKGKDIAIYGKKSLIVDLGLGRLYQWNFIVADIMFPLIGADFLANFDLLMDVRRKKLIDYFLAINPYDDTNTNREVFIQPESSECAYLRLCKYLLCNKKPSEILQHIQCIAPTASLQQDFWKGFFLSVLPPSVKPILESQYSSYSLYELTLKADQMYNELYENSYRRLLILDRNSGLCFLIDSGANNSLFPPLPNEKVTPIPLNSLWRANGSPVIEYGQKRLVLDLGLGYSFPWNFIVSDTEMPIIGADFLSHFDLLVDLKRKRLIRNQSQ
ncbi:unnamed protein product [Hymenolepis diminuta]|uniref:Peptidase A2 domain-containing protein n=1 Tax=Hymenolepis diminuta TaxID=6216 RepID=A0A564Z5X1_HYMDI|nr:unnamed protein product [Hymenolepis diminuta]